MYILNENKQILLTTRFLDLGSDGSMIHDVTGL